MAQRPKYDPSPAEACRSWIDQYQHSFHLAVDCGRQLAHPSSRRNYGNVVAQCAREVQDAARDAHALTFIAACIRKGYGHNVYTRRRRRRSR